jgi:hypothetical protein
MSVADPPLEPPVLGDELTDGLYELPELLPPERSTGCDSSSMIAF